jgi:hypothetical protein
MASSKEKPEQIAPFKFSIFDQDDLKKLIPWMIEQKAKSKQILAERVPHIPEPARMGAIGGNFSYIFTPTTIGMLVTVKCGVTEEELFLDGGI